MYLMQEHICQKPPSNKGWIFTTRTVVIATWYFCACTTINKFYVLQNTFHRSWMLFLKQMLLPPSPIPEDHSRGRHLPLDSRRVHRRWPERMPLTPVFQKSSPKMTREDATYPCIPEEFTEDDQRRRHLPLDSRRVRQRWPERTPLTPGFQKSSLKMTREDATYPWVPEEFAKDDQRRRHLPLGSRRVRQRWPERTPSCWDQRSRRWSTAAPSWLSRSSGTGYTVRSAPAHLCCHLSGCNCMRTAKKVK